MSNRLKATHDRLDKFDYFVLMGAAVNLIVVVYLVVFWLIAG